MRRGICWDSGNSYVESRKSVQGEGKEYREEVGGSCLLRKGTQGGKRNGACWTLKKLGPMGGNRFFRGQTVPRAQGGREGSLLQTSQRGDKPQKKRKKKKTRMEWEKVEKWGSLDGTPVGSRERIIRAGAVLDFAVRRERIPLCNFNHNKHTTGVRNEEHSAQTRTWQQENAEVKHLRRTLLRRSCKTVPKGKLEK